MDDWVPNPDWPVLCKLSPDWPVLCVPNTDWFMLNAPPPPPPDVTGFPNSPVPEEDEAAGFPNSPELVVAGLPKSPVEDPVD